EGILGHGRRRPCPGARPRARAVALDWGIFSQHFRGAFIQPLHTVRVPLKIRHRPSRKTMVTPAQERVPAMTTRADPALVKALARAFRYQRMFDEGRYASISEMAEAEQIERGYLGTLLRQTLLSPSIVELILNGRPPGDLTLPELLEPFPARWLDQRSGKLEPDMDE
ncbi:hypothetical protein ACFQS7_28695, partial [Dankookia sp. GCM10030260]|uniref:hypothetical protein n=1 Tax=Dankookia sp. GCM10030260 TaxID=3273390 RepID=UPI00361B5FB8